MLQFNTELINNEKIKTFISVVAAVIMYFIDPLYDAAITAAWVLSALRIYAHNGLCKGVKL